jgi:hypothetical protein
VQAIFGASVAAVIAGFQGSPLALVLSNIRSTSITRSLRWKGLDRTLASGAT